MQMMMMNMTARTEVVRVTAAARLYLGRVVR